MILLVDRPLGLRCPQMPEDTFSHGAAYIFSVLPKCVNIFQGSVVQSIVSLTRSLVRKMLTVLVSTMTGISAEKMQKLLTFFQQIH